MVIEAGEVGALMVTIRTNSAHLLGKKLIADWTDKSWVDDSLANKMKLFFSS